MPLSIPVVVCSGFTGGETPVGHVRLRPYEVGDASHKFASTYILQMGTHYDKYIVSGYLPRYAAVAQVYTTAALAATMTKKIRAPSVTGNIGESIAALVGRRKFRSSRATDIQPIAAPPNAKAPDFRMRFRPMFPGSFQAATNANPQIQFDYWPVESKAAETPALADRYMRRALAQLGTYWYERFPDEPSVAGFGIAMCFIYRGNAPQFQRLIRVHIFTPADPAHFQEAIEEFRDDENREDYLELLQTANSDLRGYLNDLD